MRFGSTHWARRERFRSTRPTGSSVQAGVHVRPAILRDADHRGRPPHAAEHALSEEEALQRGLEEKAREFTEKGAELYAKV